MNKGRFNTYIWHLHLYLLCVFTDTCIFELYTLMSQIINVTTVHVSDTANVLHSNEQTKIRTVIHCHTHTLSYRPPCILLLYVFIVNLSSDFHHQKIRGRWKTMNDSIKNICTVIINIFIITLLKSVTTLLFLIWFSNN